MKADAMFKVVEAEPGDDDGGSPAMTLVRMVWKHNREATGFSWTRLNQSMRAAVVLAIEAGMRFAEDDFAAFSDGFSMGRWGINDGGNMMGESFYCKAVEMGNLSACQSFEKWKGRKPFMHEGARLHLHSQFQWRGDLVTLTSFADDGGSVVACTYKSHPKTKMPTSKVDKRITITLEELRRVNRLIEKSHKTNAVLCAACGEEVSTEGPCPKCKARVGIKQGRFGKLCAA